MIRSHRAIPPATLHRIIPGEIAETSDPYNARQAYRVLTYGLFAVAVVVIALAVML